MGREYNRLVFEETLALIDSDPELSSSVLRSKEGQMFVPCYKVLQTPKDRGFRISISVTGERSFQAAERLEGKVCVLNFASPTHPGGGVANGSSAQEESLCRISTLYRCLRTEETESLFYEPHKRIPGHLYDPDIIYTPDVKVFRKDDDRMDILPKDGWYSVDVITCAAPNLNRAPIDEREQYDAMRERAERILSVAAEKGAESLVLGAFGCGVFGNDPKIVAKAFRDALENCSGSFREIVFAIYGKESNLDAFRDVFL